MAAIRGKSTDGPVSRLINRRISSRITALILEAGLPLTPNQVSAASFLTALAGALLFLKGASPLAGVLVQLSSIIDGVDGELARARRMASPIGAFVDSVLDRLADAAVVAGLTFTAYKAWGRWALAPGFAALAGSLMVSYLHSQGLAALGLHVSRLGRVPMYASRDVRLFIVFLGGVLGMPMTTLLILSALTLSYVLLKTLDVYLHYPHGKASAAAPDEVRREGE